jgi:non-ribosomal peptide synthetase component F
VFFPLLTGTRLVLVRPEGHRDATCLAALIARTQVTTTYFVPPLLRAFLETGRSGVSPTEARLCGSGEAPRRDLVTRAQQQWPRAAIRNLYGPDRSGRGLVASEPFHNEPLSTSSSNGCASRCGGRRINIRTTRLP